MTDERKVVEYLRRVTADLHETRQRLSEVESNMREPIAIVGMACRYPGEVGSPEDLWRLVAGGVDATSEFPADRGWPEDLYDPDPDASGKSYVRRGGFLGDVAGFDADFFGISPREALAMDPQQRLLLEVAWEALERAGLKAEELRGSRTGVFVGASTSGYIPELDQAPDTVEGYTLTGNHASVLSGRVSYFLGLEGPAVTVDTACSSSLVALHLAVQALRQGECSLALAGGVTVITNPTAFVEFSRQRGLAEDGRCKPFSASADGTSWAEGVGVLAVERLSDARRLGHRVLGVVRGSAVNQDGASSGLTVPNGPSQQRVIRAALENAGLRAADVDVVEAHGTGTRLGDPIEAQALIATYGRERPEGRALWLGSVKSNIGHAQAAAGVAGVIKMVMALRQGELPPSLYAGEPTPMVDWSAGSVSLLAEGVAWACGERVRRAGVSSFGVSGTNAHVIVEEAPEVERPEVAVSGPGLVSWVVSGASEGGLRGQVERLVSFVGERPETDAGSVAVGLAGRAGLRRRLAVVGGSVEELVAGLESAVREQGVVAREGVRVGLLFAGQGAQWPGMGRELYEQSPLFAGVVDEVCGVLDGVMGGSVREVMFGLGADREVLHQTVWAQAALFVLEVGLFRLVESWGVAPDVVLGHSVGEIAAAHVAGVLSLEDACALVAARGRLMQELPSGGAMASVAAGADVVEPLIAGVAGVGIAAVNGPASTVVSGDEDAVTVVMDACAEQGIRTRRLRVSHAFHSARMDPMLAEFRSVVEGLEFRDPAIGFVSTLLGRLAEPGELSRAEYWVRQVREPVLFAAAVGEALKGGVSAFLEVGPGGTLTAMAQECVPDSDTLMVSMLRKDRPESASVLQAAGKLWTRGVEIDWRSILPPAPPVELPTYAFDHTPYWLGRSKNGVDVSGVGLREVGHGLVSVAVEVAAGDSVVLSGRLSPVSDGWLKDHSVAEQTVFPGGGFVEMVVRAADEVGCGRVDELALQAPLLIPADGAVDLQIVVGAADGNQRREVAVYARPADSERWTRHAQATVAPGTPAELAVAPSGAWPPDGARPVDLDARYEELRADGYTYGPVFQSLERAWRVGDEVLAEAELPQTTADDTDRFGLHPALWEAAAQAVGLTQPDRPSTEAGALTASVWQGVTLRATGATRLRLRVRPTGTDTARVEMADSTGEPVAVIECVTVRRTTAAELTGNAADGTDGLFTLAWTRIGDAATTAQPSDVSVAVAGDEAEGSADEADIVVLPVFDSLAADAEADEEADEDNRADADAEGVGAVAERLLGALQRWLADERNATRRLAVVTRGAVAACEDTDEALPDVPGLAASVAWGMVRTAQSEHPDRFLLLDLDPAVGGSELPDLVAKAARTGEPQLALRGERFLAPRLRRSTGAARQGAAPDPAGTVLITGGTGMLGRLLARHLVTTHQARHLLLVGRRGPEAPGAAELRDELTALGAEVRVAACDVTDHVALAALLAGIPAEHPLTTVVHAAGVTRNGVLSDVEPQELHTALRARIAGALNLHHLTRDLPLSAFVLFSSAAGTVGSSGHTTLATAAAFLDALAHHRRARGLNALSLVWGAWAPEGPSARPLTDSDTVRLAREGAVPLPAAEGLALFDAASAVGAAQLVASKIDASALRARAAAGVLSPLWHDLFRTTARRRSANDSGDSPGSRAFARQLLDLGEEERERVAVDLVRRHAAAVLGHASPSQVDPQRGLMDAGFDSLTAVEFRNRLAAETGLHLPATLIFDHPTPAALATFVLTETLGASADPDAGDTVVARVAVDDEPIAIVGMACRYPGGVGSPEDLWRLVAGGVDATSEFPADRGWPEDLYDPDPDASGKSYVRRGGFLDDVAGFDADFFGISRREALAMDPQQRLLLEVAWEALERAGLKAQELRGSRTGVFIGATNSAYVPDMDRVPEAIEGYAQTGNTLSVLSGRVSYTFGFEGPSVSVDTACSSSLVALHLAVQALRQGECSLALAGGVTVIASPGGFVDFSRQRALSPEGRCKPFAASADGTTWAEGVGLVMFERLSDARRLGHRVLGVVRGSAVNQDGASSGLTAPNGPSQQRVIRAALENAGLRAADVDAVEAHGTGTKLGDPIEAQALIATYGQDRPEGRPLWLGSMKSNIGHSVAAAGVAGVIKMVMALRQGELPPSLYAGEPTPMVDWSAGSVSLLAEGVAWARGERVRRAGVSSFGVSGTNAHVIVEEAPAEEPAAEPVSDGAGLVSWVLSGASAGGLRGQAERLVSFVDQRPEAGAASIAAALAGREGLRHRLAVVGESAEELVEGLESLLSGDLSSGAAQGVAGTEPKVVFVFPGQGWQWVEMGVELLAASEVFARVVGECSAVVEELAGWSVLEVLRREPGAPGFDRVDVVQPVMFSVMVGLARLWESVGVVPSAVVGHSQGEIAAAHVAGVLSLEDAVRVVVARSHALVEICGQGAMASVALGCAEVQERIAGLESVSVAAVNGPNSTVVSGGAEEIAALVAGLAASGVRARRIDVDYASHSVRVEQVRHRIEVDLASVQPCAGRVPVYSTLRGEVLTGPEMDGRYWYANLRGRVEFEQAVRGLLADGFTTLVECSAHPVLTPGIGETVDTVPGAQVTVTGTLRRDDGGLRRFLTSAGTLWTAGVDVDWSCLLPEAAPVELPTYAFDRSRFWLERTTGTGNASGMGLGAVEHGLVSAVVEVAAGGAVVLCGRLSRSRQRWLADHAVSGQVLFPGTGFMDLVLRAADQVGCQVVEELVVQAPLLLPDSGDVDLQIVTEPAGDGGGRQVVVCSRPAGTDSVWTQHAQAVIAQGSTLDVGPVGVWPPSGAEVIDVSGLYEELAGRGYAYGPVFRGVRAAWRQGPDVYGEIELPESAVEEAARFGLHPALCDAAAHLLQFSEVLDQDGVWLPFAWNGVRLLATGATRLRVRIAPLGEGSVRMDLYDVAGEPVAVVGQLTARRLDAAELQPTSTAGARGLFALTWPALPTPDSPQPTATDTFVWTAHDTDMADTWDLPRITDLDDLPASARAVVLPVSGRGRDLADVACDVLAALQAWLARDHPARLVVTTRGAVGVDTGTGADVTDLAASGTWGMVRTAQTEHPDRFTLLDLDPDLDPDEPDPSALLQALAVAGEPQLAWRDGKLHAPRLVRALSGSGVIHGVSGFGAGDNWRITPQGAGSLDALAKTPHEAATRPLNPGEVRIEVRAAGLNFYDVAVAIGMVDSSDGLGAEGAGVVTEIGPEVTRFAVGDRVMGAFPAAFAVRTIADERMLVPIPAAWSFENAASVPAVFLTAFYALHDLAHIKPGQRVLIHSAAGGVGMAATQLARHFGADVYTTAHPTKWHTLKAAGIPADHIASSRTTDFADQFRHPTRHTGQNGRPGMDIILGSLSGDLVDASLNLLAPGGHYIEMGKTDIRDPHHVATTHPGTTYRAFDLKEAGPSRTGEMLTRLLTLFNDGALTLLPRTEWDLAHLPTALRRMSQARHTGKNVIRIPRPLNPHGTVLITGGTGTLGSLIARHLAHHHHIRHFLLLSRQGPHAPTAPQLHHDLTHTGAHTTITACDLTDPHALAKTLADIPTEHPLTAVIHATGHLDDATLTTLTPTQLRTVLATKATTAHHLHHHTQVHNPALFLLFSSAGSILGSPGQANYSTANTYLDALAHHRRHHNQPATSLAWGLWQQTSTMTSHLDEQDLARLARSALKPMPTPEALELFDAVGVPPQPLLMVSPLNTQAIPAHPVWQRLSTQRRTAASVEQGPQLAQQLGSLPPAQRFNVLLDHIRRHIATILALPGVDAVDAHLGFMEQGLDSLTAVELRNRLATSTGLTLPAITVFDHPTPTALTHHLLPQLTTTPDHAEDTGTDGPGGPGEEEIRRAIAGLSLTQLRDAGLFEPLMVLTGLGAVDTAEDAEEQSAIDDMDVDDLVQAALAEDS